MGDPYEGVMKDRKRREENAYGRRKPRALSIQDEDIMSDREQTDLLCRALGISDEDWFQLGDQARRVLAEGLPAFVARFVKKSLHYGPTNANKLGPAGQFADMWRKIWPLKRALWDGEQLTEEGPEEICKDLIGHSLLTIDMLQQGVDRRGDDAA